MAQRDSGKRIDPPKAGRRRKSARRRLHDGTEMPQQKAGHPHAHGHMLEDTRLSHRANAGQRAEILSDLQQTRGNAYVQRLLHSQGIQAKMTVTPPGDQHEQEADRVADRLARAPETKVQRQAEEETIQTRTIRRQSRKVSKKGSGSGVPSVSDELERRIDAARGSGRAVPGSIRKSFEPALGKDLGGVRIHTDSEADALSRGLDARAFTTGQDVFFRSGDYDPDSEEGRRLLGHEMTHVVQQGAAGISREEAMPEDEAAVDRARAEAELDKAREQASGEPTAASIRPLLVWAARCQELGAEGPAREALDEAAKKAVEILREQAKELDVQTATEGMARELLEQLATVQLLGADEEEAVEDAMEQVLQWAQALLDAAIETLQESPSEDAAGTVAEQSALVQMLGGDPIPGIEALRQWAVEQAAAEEQAVQATE